MSVAAVREYLKQWGKETAVREFDQSSATVVLAAAALGVIPARIAKTLSFKTESGSDQGCVLVVTAGDARIASGKYKAFFGKKPMMLGAEEVLRHTGHPVGGVCPFALADPGAHVYLDLSLQRFTTVFPACGSGNSAVEMTPDELFACSGAKAWVDVCSGWRETE